MQGFKDNLCIFIDKGTPLETSQGKVMKTEEKAKPF